jgi:DMSO/TMAO reductase YedYZ molybdopterin-dependent catalytic subunit
VKLLSAVQHWMAELVGLAVPFIVFLTTPHAAFAFPSSAPPPAPGCKAGVSKSFGVSGDVINPQSFTLGKLQEFKPSTTVQDDFVRGSSAISGEFAGVLLWDLLNKVGISINPKVKNDLDRKYVVVTGADCYQAVFAMSELDPSAAGSTQITVAYAQWINGQEASLVGNGFARLIVPGDKKGARRVSNIAQIQVISVPPPTP